jgi:hypothetical protein
MDVSLREFVETGRFGRVCLGMSKAWVESILGAPDDTGGTSRKHREPAIWRYGDVEFHFDVRDGGLWLIHLDDFDLPSGGKSIALDPWIIRGSLTLAEAEERLTLDGVAYEVADCEDDKLLTTWAGVKLLFSGGGTLLRAVSFSGRPAAEAPLATRHKHFH